MISGTGRAQRRILRGRLPRRSRRSGALGRNHRACQKTFARVDEIAVGPGHAKPRGCGAYRPKASDDAVHPSQGKPVTAIRADYEFAIAFRVPPPPPPPVPPPPRRLKLRRDGRHFLHDRRVDRSGVPTRGTSNREPSRQAEKQQCVAHEIVSPEIPIGNDVASLWFHAIAVRCATHLGSQTATSAFEVRSKLSSPRLVSTAPCPPLSTPWPLMEKRQTRSLSGLPARARVVPKLGAVVIEHQRWIFRHGNPDAVRELVVELCWRPAGIAEGG